MTTSKTSPVAVSSHIDCRTGSAAAVSNRDRHRLNPKRTLLALHERDLELSHRRSTIDRVCVREHVTCFTDRMHFGTN